MEDQNTIQNKTATTIGFVGVLLGVLVNTVSTIKLEEYNIFNFYFFIAFVLLATACLIMSAITAILTHLNGQEYELENLLTDSQSWLLMGLIFLTSAIPVIIFKNDPKKFGVTLFAFFILILIALNLEITSTHKHKKIK